MGEWMIFEDDYWAIREVLTELLEGASASSVLLVDHSGQIITSQGRDPILPRDERLLSAKVPAAGFNRELGAIIATVELTSQAGRAALANLEL